MKTKFILHGGMSSQKNPQNVSFFQEFSVNLKDGDTVVYVPFALESAADQEEVFQRDKTTILEHTDKSLHVEQATLAAFQQQLKSADAVFVTGGTTKILKERLETRPDFLELLKGKTYAGSSAGANVVSAFHTSGFADGIQKGLGIVPIKLMAHYGNSEFNATEENVKWFDDCPEDMDLVLLPECEWVVREVEL